MLLTDDPQLVSSDMATMGNSSSDFIVLCVCVIKCYLMMETGVPVRTLENTVGTTDPGVRIHP